ncbi:hypothetical protein [Endozoicomonas sp. 2B-B]
MNVSDSKFPPVIIQPQLTVQKAPDNNSKCPDDVASNYVVGVGGGSFIGAIVGTVCGAAFYYCNPVVAQGSTAFLTSTVCCLSTCTVVGAACGTYAAYKCPCRTGLKERAITGSTMTNTLTGEQQQCQGLPSALTSLAAGNSSGSTGPVRSQPTAAGCPRIGAAVRYQPNAGAPSLSVDLKIYP